MSAGGVSLLDGVVIVAYFAAMAWLGARVRRKQRNSSEYFLGRQSIPAWALAMSMFATILSTWAFLALPGKGFQSNLQYLMAVSMVPLAAWVSARWIVPIFRERVKLSAYQYLHDRFGVVARLYGNLAFIIVHFGKMAAVLYLLCLAIAGMTGWNIFVLIAVIGLSSVIFSFLGGIEGVIWTEVVEGFLLLMAAIIAIGFIFAAAPGGVGAVVGTAVDAGKFKLVSFDFAWDRSNTIVLLFFSANYYLQKYITDQTIVQRMLLAPSHEQAARAIWRSSLLVLGIWMLFMSVGVLLWAFYALQPGLLPDSVRGAPDRVFPHFIGHSLPNGVSGLLLAALIAGTMSTLSADLNSLGSVLLEDYYKRIFRASGEVRQLWFSRIVTLVTGIACVLLAMGFTRIQSMADATLDFVSLVGGGVLGMFLLGICTRRATAKGLYVGIACSVVFVLWAHFCGPGKNSLPILPRCPLHTLWVGLLGNVVVFVVGYIASRLLSSPRVVAPAIFYEQSKSSVYK